MQVLPADEAVIFQLHVHGVLAPPVLRQRARAGQKAAAAPAPAELVFQHVFRDLPQPRLGMLDLLLLDGLPRDAERLLYGLLRRVVVGELAGVVKDQRRVLPVPLFHQQTLVLTVQTDSLRSGSFFCDFILF